MWVLNSLNVQYTFLLLSFPLCLTNDEEKKQLRKRQQWDMVERERVKPAAPNENSLKIFYSSVSRQTFDMNIPEEWEWKIEKFSHMTNTTGDHHILTDFSQGIILNHFFAQDSFVSILCAKLLRANDLSPAENHFIHICTGPIHSFACENLIKLLLTAKMNRE